MIRKYPILLLVLLSLFVTPSWAMNKAELVDAIASDANLSKADAKRALESLGKETAKQLKKGSALVPHLGLFAAGNGVDDDCDGVLTDSDDDRKGKKGKKKKPECIEFFPEAPGDAEIVKTYLENYFADAMNEHAALQDYNAARNVSPVSAVDGTAQQEKLEAKMATANPLYCQPRNKGENPLYQRAAITVPSAESMRDIYRALDVPAAFDNAALVPEIEKNWGESLAGSMQLICLSPDLAQAFVTDMMSAFSEQAMRAQEIRKEVQDKKNNSIAAGGSGSGNDTLLEKAARHARMDIDVLNRVLLAAAEIIHRELALGAEVESDGFGSFSISARAARTGRNPQTGKEIQIAAKNVVRFKAGSELSGKVN